MQEVSDRVQEHGKAETKGNNDRENSGCMPGGKGMIRQGVFVCNGLRMDQIRPKSWVSLFHNSNRNMADG